MKSISPGHGSTLAVALMSILATTLGACATDELGGTEPQAAEAEQSSAWSTHEQSATPRHCVLRAESGQLSCFDTFTEAVAAGTGGRVSDAPSDPKAALSDPAFVARATIKPSISPGGGGGDGGSTILIGTVYMDADFGGGSLSVSAATGCDGLSDVDYVIPDLTIVNSWNDTISSFQGFANCLVSLCVDVSFGGGCSPPESSSSFVGLYNDLASSLRFH